MAKLDKHFKCPKEIKISTMYQSRELKRSMYEAHQNFLDYKKRSLKAPKSENSAVTA